MTSQSTLCEVGEMTRNEQEQLFQQHLDLVYFAMWKYYPTFAKDEDLKQEALMGLWQACLTYDESKSKFSTYAVSCMLNKMKVWLRDRSKHPDTVSLNSPVGGYEEEGLTLEDTIEDPVPAIDEGYIDLKDFLASLSERDQKIVKLRMQGLTQKQIAQELGMTRVNCSMRLTRIWVKFVERRNEDEQEN